MNNLKNCFSNIPNSIIIGSAIILFCIVFTTLYDLVIGGKLVNVFIQFSLMISAFTLTALTIASLKENIRDQGAFKKLGKLITACLFLGMAIILSIIWIKCSFSACVGLGEGIFAVISLTTMGIVSGLWIVYFVVGCFRDWLARREKQPNYPDSS